MPASVGGELTGSDHCTPALRLNCPLGVVVTHSWSVGGIWRNRMGGSKTKGFSGDQKAFQAKAIDPSTAAAVADVIQLMEGGPPMNDGVYQRKCQTVAGPFSSGKYAKH